MESSKNEDENAVNVSNVVDERELVDEILARRRLTTLERERLCISLQPGGGRLSREPLSTNRRKLLEKLVKNIVNRRARRGAARNSGKVYECASLTTCKRERWTGEIAARRVPKRRDASAALPAGLFIRPARRDDVQRQCYASLARKELAKSLWRCRGCGRVVTARADG